VYVGEGRILGAAGSGSYWLTRMRGNISYEIWYEFEQGLAINACAMPHYSTTTVCNHTPQLYHIHSYRIP